MRDCRVPHDRLRWTCDPKSFPFATTDEIVCGEGIIGQDRAVEAIRLGLQVRSKGYNIFICGDPGSGRTTSVKHLLETIEIPSDPPKDVVYVNNFKNTDQPVSILLPAGQGKGLKQDMVDLIAHMRTNIQQIYESEAYKDRTKDVVERYKEREKELIRLFEERIREESFALIQVQLGPFSKPEIAPLIDGEPKQIDRLEALAREGKFPKEEADKLRAKYEELTAYMEETFRNARNLKRGLRSELADLEKEFGRPVIGDYIDDLKANYSSEKVHVYLDGVRDHILTHMDQFTEREGEEQQGAGHPESDQERFLAYQVNLLVDNAGLDRPPVVVETSPNYRNLFGTIEKVVDRSGHWRSDFIRIKAGSLLQANGGVLVLNLYDFMAEPGVWQALKRTLKNRLVDIHGYDPLYMFSASALKPEPIPVRVRVVVIGDAYAYRVLHGLDPDFRKIFKIKAEFDSVMPRNDEGLDHYARFIRKIQSREDLLPLDRSGVAAVVEEGVRRAGRQSKLTTRFSEIADLLRESSYWAAEEGASIVTADHVRLAVDKRTHRVGMIEDKIQELINEGVLLIDSAGGAIGQVNGLSVIDIGDHAFGRPNRITAKTSVGRAGVINIEREADLSGNTHNKGVLILEGFLRNAFAQDKPIAMSASLAFEQSYSGIDGDSASSAEVYALMSSLARVPLRQDLAVTGSVNQHGQIQPIGGVNEKVEGFYEVCNERGLTGTQGVLIPETNVADLMLKPEVVAAVRDGRFHIYAVRTVEEGLEILTGVPPGERQAAGGYPPESIYGRVDERLRSFARAMSAFAKGAGGTDGAAGTGETGAQ